MDKDSPIATTQTIGQWHMDIPVDMSSLVQAVPTNAVHPLSLYANGSLQLDVYICQSTQ